MKYYGMTKENLDKLDSILQELPHKITMPIIQAMGKLVEIEVPEKEEPEQ